jgi:hypothetical protein
MLQLSGMAFLGLGSLEDLQGWGFEIRVGAGVIGERLHV